MARLDTSPASHVRLVHARGYAHNRVYVTVQGRELQLTDGAISAFLLAGGRYVAWSGPDGVRGPYGVGQSLYVYDTRTRAVARVMAELAAVEQVEAISLSNGEEAFVVALRDVGAVAPHLAIVHPQRGQVFRGLLTEAYDRRGDLLRLRTFVLGDKRATLEEFQLDLKVLMRGPVLEAAPTVQ